MPMEKQNAFTAWLEEQMAECALQKKKFEADSRSDEANFEKIRSNVYDIFRTILTVGGKTCGEDGAGGFFWNKIREIPASWETSYQAAQQHGDVKKMEIERIKLDTIRQIREKFSEIWEGVA